MRTTGRYITGLDPIVLGGIFVVGLLFFFVAVVWDKYEKKNHSGAANMREQYPKFLPIAHHVGTSFNNVYLS